MNVTTLMRLVQTLVDKNAEFQKLVRYVRVKNLYKQQRIMGRWAHITQKHVDEALQALSPETRRLIDEAE
jgi:hypothetical protein